MAINRLAILEQQLKTMRPLLPIKILFTVQWRFIRTIHPSLGRDCIIF